MNNTIDTSPVPDFRELRMLEELGTATPVTQRELAGKVGIALGLANAILKRLAHQGFIKVRNLDARRLGYSITPKGMQEKSRLAYRTMVRTVDFYKQARYRVKHNLLKARAAGIEKVAIFGINDVAEIVFLTLQELDMTLDLVVSPGHPGETWLGRPVRSVEVLKSSGVDAVIVTDLNKTPGAYPEFDGIPARVWWLDA